MTQDVCVGGEFTTDGSGRLKLAGLPTLAWPFASSAMPSANGLRVDPAGGPWVPQTGFTPVTQVQHKTDTTPLAPTADPAKTYEVNLNPWYLTNPSAYQQMAFTGWVEFGVALQTNGSTWVEQWGSVAYTPAPGAAAYTGPWQALASDSPMVGITWHSSRCLNVQMVVDVADQTSLTVRAGARSVQGDAVNVATMRDWWVALYGVAFLLDPGPVG